MNELEPSQAEEEPIGRVIVTDKNEQFAPKNFVLIYLKDDKVSSLIRISDISYNESLAMLSEISGAMNDFVDGFISNFYETDEEEAQ